MYEKHGKNPLDWFTEARARMHSSTLREFFKKGGTHNISGKGIDFEVSQL